MQKFIRDTYKLTMLSKLNSLLSISVSRNWGLSYLMSPERSISSFKIVTNLKKTVLDIHTVIDVGANIGQFASAIKCEYPNAKVHCFEPVPETFSKLSQNKSNASTVKLYPIALGNTKGKISFFQNEHSHASSILEVSDEQKAALPETSAYKKIEVDIETLDEVSAGFEIEHPLLLKLDVQGFEKDVLLGATEFLKQVDYLLLEMSFIPMYKNEPLFDEMHRFITDKGFEIVGPVGSLPDSQGVIMQMDMLYKKK